MKKLLLIALFAAACNARAESATAFFSGNDLLNLDAHGFTGYVTGVTDMILTNNPRGVCIATQVTIGELVAVVRKYYVDHPEMRHYTAASSIAVALKAAFPCK